MKARTLSLVFGTLLTLGCDKTGTANAGSPTLEAAQPEASTPLTSSTQVEDNGLAGEGDQVHGDNKRNLLYFEASSMQELFVEMDKWQTKHRKRLQSVSIQPDGGTFAAIALSNPSEVIIVNGQGKGGLAVWANTLNSFNQYGTLLTAQPAPNK